MDVKGMGIPGVNIDRTTMAERAMVVAFAELNSTAVRNNGMAISSEKGKVMKLSDYLLSTRNQEFVENLAKGNFDIDALDKVYVVLGSPQKGAYKGQYEIGAIINMGKNEMFRDASGDFFKDLGVLSFDSEGKEASFDLDSKIRSEQKEALGSLMEGDTKEAEAYREEFGIDSLDDLVRLGKEKERILPQGKEEVGRRVEKQGIEFDEKAYEEATGKKVDGPENEGMDEQEMAQEQKEIEHGRTILKSIGNYPGVGLEELLAAKGISVADVKQISVVTSESSQALANSIGEDGPSQIEPDEPTIVIAVRNREANAKGDRMITIQGGTNIKENPSADRAIRSFIDDHGNGTEISNVYPSNYVEMNKGNENADRIYFEGGSKEDIEFLQEQLDKIDAEVKEKIASVEAQTENPVEQKALKAEIYANAYGRVENLRTSGSSNVNVPIEVSDRYRAEANLAVDELEKEKIKQGVKELGKAAIGVAEIAGAIVSGAKTYEDVQEQEAQEYRPSGRPLI